jgi:hypothetical protein
MPKPNERERPLTGAAGGSGSPPGEAGAEAIPERLLVLARRLQQQLDALREPAPADDPDKHQ